MCCIVIAVCIELIGENAQTRNLFRFHGYLSFNRFNEGSTTIPTHTQKNTAINKNITMTIHLQTRKPPRSSTQP